MHKRQQIRDQIVEKLKGQTRCGDRVFSNRGRSFFATELPSITLYTESETSTFLHPPETRLKRTMRLVIEAASIQETHIDNELDDLGAEIEAALPNFHIFQNDIQSMQLAESEIGISDRGEKIIGSIRLVYEVEYETP